VHGITGARWRGGVTGSLHRSGIAGQVRGLVGRRTKGAWHRARTYHVASAGPRFRASYGPRRRRRPAFQPTPERRGRGPRYIAACRRRDRLSLFERVGVGPRGYSGELGLELGRAKRPRSSARRSRAKGHVGGALSWPGAAVAGSRRCRCSPAATRGRAAAMAGRIGPGKGHFAAQDRRRELRQAVAHEWAAFQVTDGDVPCRCDGAKRRAAPSRGALGDELAPKGGWRRPEGLARPVTGGQQPWLFFFLGGGRRGRHELAARAGKRGPQRAQACSPGHGARASRPAGRPRSTASR